MATKKVIAMITMMKQYFSVWTQDSKKSRRSTWKNPRIEWKKSYKNCVGGCIFDER